MGLRRGWGAGRGQQPPGSGTGTGSGCAGSTGDASTSVRLRAGPGPGTVVWDAGDWETQRKTGVKEEEEGGKAMGDGARVPGAKRPGLPPQRFRIHPAPGIQEGSVGLSPITSARSPRPLETTGTHAEGRRWQPAPRSTAAAPDPAPLTPRGIPGAEAGAEPGGMVRGAARQSCRGDPEPNRSATTGAPRTPRKPAARRGRLPATGLRRPPYLEVAPHVLGHWVIIDVEWEGELGVRLQHRWWHQDHAAGIHLPGGYGTVGSYGMGTGMGTRGWEWCRWWRGTRSPAAASSSPISSAGISRWVTSTTSLLVSSCRRSTGMHPLATLLPAPAPMGALASSMGTGEHMAGMRAQQHALHRLHSCMLPSAPRTRSPLPVSSSPSPPPPAGGHPPFSASRAAALSPCQHGGVPRGSGTPLGCHHPPSITRLSPQRGTAYMPQGMEEVVEMGYGGAQDLGVPLCPLQTHH